MIMSMTDAEVAIQSLFSMVDAIYGSDLHHIGDGDGICSEDAQNIRALCEHYASGIFHDGKVAISTNPLQHNVIQ